MIQRSKFRLLAVLTLGLVGCAAGRLPPTNDMRISGVLTRRGAQIESWLSVRSSDGTLWRLEPANAQIADQLNQLLQQNVLLTGEAISSAMPPPSFRVREVSVVK